MKIVLLSLLLFVSTLFGSVGKISAMSGGVSITRGSQNVNAKVGTLIEQKDKIKIGNNGRLQLVFKDKTVISLGKNAIFNVNEYFYDEQKPDKIKAHFSVARGIFKAISGKIAKINPDKFKLKTKTATIGIRGTVFFGDIAPGKPDSIACTKGKIVVTTAQGAVEVPAGQITSVELGKAPTPPKPLPVAKAKVLQKDSGASKNEKESGENEKTVQKAKDNTPSPKKKKKDSGSTASNKDKKDKKSVASNKEKKDKQSVASNKEKKDKQSVASNKEKKDTGSVASNKGKKDNGNALLPTKNEKDGTPTTPSNTTPPVDTPPTTPVVDTKVQVEQPKVAVDIATINKVATSTSDIASDVVNNTIAKENEASTTSANDTPSDVTDDTSSDVTDDTSSDVTDDTSSPVVNYSGEYASDYYGVPITATKTDNSYSGYFGFDGGTHEYYDENGDPFTAAAIYIPFTNAITGEATNFSGTYAYAYKDSDGNIVESKYPATGTITPSASTLYGFASWGTTTMTIDYSSTDSSNAGPSVPETELGTYILGDTSKKVDDIASYVSSLTQSEQTATYQGAITGYLNNTTFINPTLSWLNMIINFNANTADVALHINGQANWAKVTDATFGIDEDDYYIYGASTTGFYGDISLRGSLYNKGANTIGSFYGWNGEDRAFGVFDATKPKTAATKSVTYYSMHSGTNQLDFYTDGNGNRQSVDGSSEDRYKVRDGYASSYVMKNGILTVDDVLTKYKYDVDNKKYVIDSTKDHSFTSDLSDAIIRPSYVGFKNVKVKTDPDRPNLEGAVFWDSQMEFQVLSVDEDTYYLSDGTQVYKHTDGTYDTSKDLTTTGSYVDNDIKKQYEHDRDRVFGEKTSWDKVKDLTGVSKYLDPDIDSSVGAYLPTEIDNDESTIYSTNGIYMNWDNKTFLDFYMEKDGNFLLIGSASQDNDGNAYLQLKDLNNDTNNDDFAAFGTAATGNKGYIFGSQYQGIGYTVHEEKTVGSDTYERFNTHGGFRSPVPEVATTNYTNKTATGFANDNYTESGTIAHTIGMPLNLTFTTTGVSGSIATGSSADKMITFGGAFNEQKSAYITPDTFGALNFDGKYHRNNHDYNVKNGMLVAIEDGTATDDGISWGIWAVDSDTADNDADLGRDTWVASVNQRVEDITALDDYKNGATASYAGTAMGWVGDYKTGTLIDPSKSTLNFDIDFGAGKIKNLNLSVNGGAFTGTGDNASYSLNDAKNTFSTSNIKGSLYNKGASSIGSFKMDVVDGNNNTKTAAGVYKAIKTIH